MRNRKPLTLLALLSRWMAIPTLAILVGSCAAGQADAKYAAGFEACFQTAKTCEEYLKCWQDNQRANNQPVTGSCKAEP